MVCGARWAWSTSFVRLSPRKEGGIKLFDSARSQRRFGGPQLVEMDWMSALETFATQINRTPIESASATHCLLGLGLLALTVNRKAT